MVCEHLAQRQGFFPNGSLVKNPPANADWHFQSLGRKDPLEEETEPHSNILAWEIPWPAEAGGPQSMGWHESDSTEVTQHACTPTGRLSPERARGTSQVTQQVLGVPAWILLVQTPESVPSPGVGSAV